MSRAHVTSQKGFCWSFGNHEVESVTLASDNVDPFETYIIQTISHRPLVKGVQYRVEVSLNMNHDIRADTSSNGYIRLLEHLHAGTYL